uniref:Uncharacterized protein n=1 Tax=Anguilla anguilla TaxID=7936 RepID=A0A0E9PFE2_ANGAN
MIFGTPDTVNVHFMSSVSHSDFSMHTLCTSSACWALWSCC